MLMSLSIAETSSCSGQDAEQDLGASIHSQWPSPRGDTFHVAFKTEIFGSFRAQLTAMLSPCHHCWVASRHLPEGWL